MKSRLFLLSLLCAPLFASAQTSIKECGGWFESGYATFELIDEAASYNAYCKAAGGEYIKLDDELVRNYGTYGRVDAVGLTAGEYTFKVVPVDKEGNEMESLAAESAAVAVKAHDRSGFAHFDYTGVGAYNDNGTLKTGARVFYITSRTAKSVTCDVVTDAKGKTTTYTGFQSIIDGYQKGYDKTPVAFRIIGTIEADDMDSFSSSAEGLQVKGRNAHSELNITIEGIGNDAAIRGFGILMRNATSVELRNFAVLLCKDDCISIDTDNSHCWVHHIDFFYGQTGGAADQAKGDGSLDVKGDSQYMTFSYNRFWDCGKTSLCGMTSESGENYISYHHNWFDHSDSRHPRVRTMTVHLYNNYYDGVAKYGVGATTGSNVFVESNYFRNTSKPMLISKQGTDTPTSSSPKGTFSGEDGGMIKAYGNVYAERSSKFSLITHKNNATSFDCYEADSRDEQVPDSYVTLYGGTPYNNFDTDPDVMYTYTPDDANDVPAILGGTYGAGRMQHGDLQWSFNNATDDTDSEVNSALKTAIANYKSSLVGFFTDPDGSGDNNGNDDGDGDDEGGETTPPVVPAGGYECHFTGKTPSNNFYTIVGNYSDTKGKATVNGTTYTDCLKIESSTTITFTIAEKMTLTLVFAEGSTPNIKIDGVKVAATNGNVITYELAAGTHEITKADSHNLFYINLTGDSSGMTAVKAASADAPLYDLQGRRVTAPKPGTIYIQNGKKLLYR